MNEFSQPGLILAALRQRKQSEKCLFFIGSPTLKSQSKRFMEEMYSSEWQNFFRSGYSKKKK